MHKKAVVFTVLMAFLGVFLGYGLLVAADAPDEIEIFHKKTLGEMKKGPVKFTHKKHVNDHKVKCAECHHVYKDGKNVWKEGDKVENCAACHGKAKKGNADKLQNAFHKNCQTCHKEAKKGPFKKCNECHADKK